MAGKHGGNRDGSGRPRGVPAFPVRLRIQIPLTQKPVYVALGGDAWAKKLVLAELIQQGFLGDSNGS